MKVVFLDRDGVINKEINYLHKISDFEYTYKCIQALSNIVSAGYEIIVITNQAGIARGIFTESDYNKLTKFYTQDLYSHGINILDVFYCPHHVDGVVSKYKIDCNCRKPKPGMLLEAIEKYSVDTHNSYLIGDKLSDVEAGKAAGISSLALVESGHPFDSSMSSSIPVYKNLYEFSLSLISSRDGDPSIRISRGTKAE